LPKALHHFHQPIHILHIKQVFQPAEAAPSRLLLSCTFYEIADFDAVEGLISEEHHFYDIFHLLLHCITLILLLEVITLQGFNEETILMEHVELCEYFNEQYFMSFLICEYRLDSRLSLRISQGKESRLRRLRGVCLLRR
jgi:hypothetical protein